MILITIIAFVVILSVLVFVHELGHFVSARKFGVKVREFGLGLPPRFLGLRRKGKRGTGKWEIIKGSRLRSEDTPSTIYSLNWLPIGGFVNIGEDDGDTKDPESFQAQPPGKRAFILSAGVLMNALATVVLLAIVFAIGFPQVIDPATDDLARARDRAIGVSLVLEDSPAVTAGLKIGDQIKQVDGRELVGVESFKSYVSARPGQEIKLSLERQSESIEAVVVPAEIEEVGGVGIGVGLVHTAVISYPIHEAIWQGISGTGRLIVAIFEALGSIISDLATTGKVQQEFAGPVGIAVLTGRAVNLGLVNVLEFAALLSINLAIINILPFPALDGGRIFFIIIEKLRGKPVTQKIETVTHTLGFALLIALILLVTYKDITRFGASILGIFK